ncbi:MAG: DsbA family protein [Jiangellaceae bacterium]
MSRDKAAIRARAKELREGQARQARRREQLIRFGVVAAVLAAVVAVGVAVLASRPSTGGSAALPQGITEPDGGVVIGDETAAVTVEVWIDFQCPHCRDFEESAASTLDAIVADGSAKLVYHPLSFLGEESVRAANALGCAVDEGRQAAYLRTLFENQPPVRSGGFTNDDLVSLGESAGLDGSDFGACVNDGTYDGWVSNVAASGSDAGVTATPTVLVGGQTLSSDQLTPDGLRAAVEAAAG